MSKTLAFSWPATPTEAVEYFRADRLDEFASLRSKAARWAQDNAQAFTEADPRVPDEITSDRARDNWRPLLAIADAIGGTWPDRARQAAVVLAGVESAAESASVMLLEDLCDLFTTQGSRRLPSEVIVEALINMEERPWPEWYHGRPITARGVARLLKPFGITPDTVKTPRGYSRKDFEDAFSRYIGGAHPLYPPSASQQGNYSTSHPPIEVAPEADNLPRNSCGLNALADTADTEEGCRGEDPPSSTPGGDDGLGFDEVEV
jgi:hypothetical protein